MLQGSMMSVGQSSTEVRRRLIAEGPMTSPPLEVDSSYGSRLLNSSTVRIFFDTYIVYFLE